MDIPEKNQVFEWLNLKGEVINTERVLYILPESRAWMVIRLPRNGERPQRGTQRKHDYPFRRESHEYEKAFANHTLRIAADDPFEHISALASAALRIEAEGNSDQNDAIRKPDKYSKHYERLVKNWLLIKDVVDDPRSLFKETRGKLVAEAARRANRQKSEVYAYCIRYWQGGQIAGSIAPLHTRSSGECQEVEKEGLKRGPKAGTVGGEVTIHTHLAIGPKDRAKIVKVIKRYHLRLKQPLRAAYESAIRFHWSEKIDSPNGLSLRRNLPPERRPSFRQFLYIWEKFRRKHSAYVKRKLSGEKEFTLTQRPLSDCHTRKADGPGHIFEIDAHIADCIVVHTITRLPIGRPTVYLVIDVFSHMTVGIAITLEPPSYIGAGLALINAFTDKVEFCKQYGVIIEHDQWPCHHLCKYLVADRGELLGKISQNLEVLFDIKKVNLPASRPDMKPLVERSFGRLNEKRRHRLPGAVRGPKRRGERNPQFDARLDMEQYTEIIIRTVLELNGEWKQSYKLEKPMIADGLSPVPLSIWNWGIKNRSGMLRQKSKAFVRANLLPRAKASVTRAGIVFEGLEYSLPSVLDENWQLALSDANAEVDIAYDPRLVDAIHLCDLNGIAGTQEVCKLKPAYDAHLGSSWVEVKAWMKSQAHEKKKAEDSAMSKRMENDIRMDATFREAEAKHKAAVHPSTSKAAFIKDSSGNRENARRAERQATPIIENLPDKTPDATEPTVNTKSLASRKIVHFPQESARAQEADYLRRLRDGN